MPAGTPCTADKAVSHWIHHLVYPCWMQVPVEEWRAQLWQDALAASGVQDQQDGGLGAQLQAHFTKQRTAGFVFEQRVTVCFGLLLPC